MAGSKKEALTEEEVSVMKSCGDEVNYRLTDERRQRLESIGFIWNMRESEKVAGTETARMARNSYDDQWVSYCPSLPDHSLSPTIDLSDTWLCTSSGKLRTLCLTS
jgi:hypothetical protein